MDSKECALTIAYNSRTEELVCKKGMVLLEALSKEQTAFIDTPCGGKGLCGKCKVIVSGDNIPPLSDREQEKLTSREIEDGYRLACMLRVEGDWNIFIDAKISQATILEDGVEFDIELLPSIRKNHLEVRKPTLEDQRDDFSRIRDALNIKGFRMRLSELYHLPAVLRDQDYSVTVAHNKSYIIKVEAGNTEHLNYGVAVDIGTTTVVAFLLDLSTGRKIDVVSGLNSQKSFGQDVISRINHTLQKEEGLEHLHKRIITQINGMIWDLAEKNSISIDNIYSIVLAGNTTMMHLAAGLPPANIAASPFVPVIMDRMVEPAKDLGIEIAKSGCAYFLPSISGYVGADIVAAILASGMTEKDELSLLIDIGTNGEIVLGSAEGLLCCSTAAGPAFEGAHIRYGVGGIAGAINTVKLDIDKLAVTTIADQRPLGICGSGIVDATALLIKTGILDETGRMLSKEDAIREGISLSDKLTEVDSNPALVLAGKSDARNSEPIYLTQKDVREVQLAKASIAAGISTLIKHSGKSVEDIQQVYLAGGFGSFIDKTNAVVIGLIPKELEHKIKVIGNAAGTGAVMASLSEPCLLDTDRIVKLARYVELSSSPAFQDEYISNMYFSG